MDFVPIIVGAIGLLLIILVFFILLNRSNRLLAHTTRLLNDQHRGLEKLVGKFIDMTVENRREIERLKKELSEGAKNTDLAVAAEPETEAEEIAERPVQKAVVRASRKS